MTIYLDFDGTVVEHAFPAIGKYNPFCFEVIQKLQLAGHQIILNTFRTDMNDGSLQQALDYLNHPANHLQAITKTTEMKINPANWDWKFFEKNRLVFIDDICKGIPLIDTREIVGGKMVDWPAINLQFLEKNIYTKTE